MTKLMLAVLDRERRGYGADSQARQNRDREFDRIRKLNCNSASGDDAGGLQRASDTVYGSVQLCPREPLGFTAKEGVPIRSVNERFSIRMRGYRVGNEMIQCRHEATLPRQS